MPAAPTPTAPDRPEPPADAVGSTGGGRRPSKVRRSKPTKPGDSGDLESLYVESPSVEVGRGPARPGKGRGRDVADGRPLAPESDDQAVRRLEAEIRAEQKTLHRSEGDIVRGHIAIGVKLAALKGKAGRAWTRRLEKLGYHPRVASRLMKIGKAWGGETGRIASDLLRRLPTDPNKLELLCQLDEATLRATIKRIDPKAATRPEVASAVKSALGIAPRAGAAAGRPLPASIGRQVEGLVRSIERFVTAPGAERSAEVREALAEGLSRIRAAMEKAVVEGPAG